MQYLDDLCKIWTSKFIQNAYNHKQLYYLYFIFSKYSDEMMKDVIIPFEYLYISHRFVLAGI